MTVEPTPQKKRNQSVHCPYTRLGETPPTAVSLKSADTPGRRWTQPLRILRPHTHAHTHTPTPFPPLVLLDFHHFAAHLAGGSRPVCWGLGTSLVVVYMGTARLSRASMGAKKNKNTHPPSCRTVISPRGVLEERQANFNRACGSPQLILKDTITVVTSECFPERRDTNLSLCFLKVFCHLSNGSRLCRIDMARCGGRRHDRI